MECKTLMVSEPDGIHASVTGDGRVRVETTFGGRRLRTLLVPMEAEELCAAMQAATLAAREHFDRRWRA